MDFSRKEAFIINKLSETWDKVELYIISLWLLFFLIFVVTIDVPLYFGKDSHFIGIKELIKHNPLPTASLFLLIIGMIFYSRFKYKLDGSKKTPFEIKKIENQNYEHLTFLTTYIIPLICFNFDSLRYIIVLFLLLIIIGTIYVRTNMFYANPSLALLGYHIYKADGTFRTEERPDIILISREKLSTGMKVSYKRLDEKIYFVRVKK
jgi:hypothetical protein